MTFDEWWDNETANVGRKSLGRGGMFYNFAKRAWEALEAENARMLAREALTCKAYNCVEKEIAKLREELAAAKKNAERYRWLISKLQEAYDGNDIEHADCFLIHCSMVSGFKEHRRVQAVLGWGDLRDEPLGLSTAIDAAMKEQQS